MMERDLDATLADAVRDDGPVARASEGSRRQASKARTVGNGVAVAGGRLHRLDGSDK